MANYRCNFMQNNTYQLVCPKFPDLYFYSTSFVFPSLTLPAAIAGTPFTNIPLSGDKMSFAPLVFNFMVDENCENYAKIAEWIKSISYSTSFDDYTNYTGKNQNQKLGEQDIAVIVLNSKNNPVKIFRFVNAIPVSLGGFEMTAQDPNTNYIWSQVAFEYEYFDLIDAID